MRLADQPNDHLDFFPWVENNGISPGKKAMTYKEVLKEIPCRINPPRDGGNPFKQNMDKMVTQFGNDPFWAPREEQSRSFVETVGRWSLGRMMLKKVKMGKK